MNSWVSLKNRKRQETAPAHAETENIDFLKKLIIQVSMILVDYL